MERRILVAQCQNALFLFFGQIFVVLRQLSEPLAGIWLTVSFCSHHLYIPSTQFFLTAFILKK